VGAIELLCVIISETMIGGVKFLMSFRARLILLLTAFLLLTIVLVFALDQWAQRRIDAEVRRQNEQVKEVVNSSFGAFAQALSLALSNLATEDYLYEKVSPEELPPTIKHILIADEAGNVTDSTLRQVVNQLIFVPKEERAEERSWDPVEGEAEAHGGLIKTYYFPIRTSKGLYWIIIVEQRQVIIDRIEAASHDLAQKTQLLSRIRIASITGLLVLALAIIVVIGWSFTHPIKELASSARRVAKGDLDFEVKIDRRDEVGQLAAVFNEMIAGLKSKRELEEKLNQAERAAVIGRLTQSVAHEIRNPLNVLNLSIDHVRLKFAPEDEVKRRQFMRLLSSIKDEIARLNRMVNDLLNYGRPARLSLKTIDMRELMEETIALIKPQADEQKVEVTIEADAEPACVRGDAERLKSCLSNIALNALQAMPGGGRLAARVHRRDGAVEVSISDTGVGISEDAISKIFEPYFSTKQTGFGLGLAVTKKIVEEHNGTIAVSSQMERGTTFILRLPAAEPGPVLEQQNGETTDGEKQNTCG
jgi:signal transduction histidine kinase